MTPTPRRSKRTRPPLRGRLAASAGRLHQRDRPEPLLRPDPPPSVPKPAIAPIPESPPTLIAPLRPTRPYRKPARVRPPLRGRLTASAGQRHEGGEVPEPFQRPAPFKRSRLPSVTTLTHEAPIKEPPDTAPLLPPNELPTTNPVGDEEQMGRDKRSKSQRSIIQVAISILIVGCLIWLVVSLLSRD